MTRQQYNVVIVGGGAAGLSAALMLGRARRSVLVVDAGSPRNAPAAHMQGVLTRDGTPPQEFLRIAREDVEEYGVEIHRGSVLSVDSDLTAKIDNRLPVRARRVLLAGGLRDELPDVPGLAERWGRDVLHCPYCHGWEVRDREIAVLATGPLSVHQALLWRQWTPHLTYLAHSVQPTAEEASKLAARGISVVSAQVSGLEVQADRLVGVRLRNGVTLPVDAVAVGARFSPRVPLVEGLAVEAHPSGMGTHVVSDGGRTSVPGVWVAGNSGDPSAAVPMAVASGAMAAHMINMDLINEDTALAVA